MKLRKSIAGIAAVAMTAAAVSVSASAALIIPENTDPGLSAGTGSWCIQLFNVGNEAENKPATDYGIDYSAVAKIRVVIKATDPDWMDGNPGGAIIWSNNGGDIAQGTALWDTYNWPGTWSYWGVNDADLEFEAASDQGIQANKIADYTYELIADVYDANPLHNGDAAQIGCMQSGIQYWGSDMSDYEVVDFQALDASGNVLLQFDGTGKLIASAGASSAPAAPAPAAGDVAAATDSSKGSPDTGVADVAAVAGIAVVAAGAIAVSGKRK